MAILHYTTNDGDSVEYTFRGTGVAILTESFNEAGEIDVYIDDVKQSGVFTAYTSGTRICQYEIFKVTGLSDGNHTIRAVKKSNHYFELDAFVVEAADLVSPVSAKFYTASPRDIEISIRKNADCFMGIKNGSNTLSYSSDYSISGDTVTIFSEYLGGCPAGLTKLEFGFSGDYSDDIHYTEDNGDYFKYSFTGTEVKIIGPKGPNLGELEIFIDGESCGTVNAYNLTRLTQQVLFEKSGLENIIHTIKCVKVSGDISALDAIAIFVKKAADPQPPNPGPTTPDPGPADTGSSGSSSAPSVSTANTARPNTGGDILVNETSRIKASSIDTKKDSHQINVKAIDGTASVRVPATLLSELDKETASHKNTFTLDLAVDFGTYRIPAHLSELIPDYSRILSQNKLKERDVSFQVTMTDLSSNAQWLSLLRKDMPNGKILGGFSDIQVELYNNKTEAVIATISAFTNGIQKIFQFSGIDSLSKFYGVFAYNEAEKKFEFVSHKVITVNGTKAVLVEGTSNGVYVIVENEFDFADVKQGFWGSEVIKLAAAKGLVRGVGSNMFQPNMSVTRGEFVQMLANALPLPEAKSGTGRYSDVNTEHIFAESIMNFKSAGLLRSIDSDTFSHDIPMTREEMASVLAQIVSYYNCQVPQKAVMLDKRFSDYDSMDTAFAEDIELIVRIGIMQGMGNGQFNPGGEVTRA